MDISMILGEALAISFMASIIAYLLYKFFRNKKKKTLNAKAFFFSLGLNTVIAMPVVIIGNGMDMDSLIQVFILFPVYFFTLKKLSENEKYLSHKSSEEV